MITAGIDVGSSTTKVVLVENNDILSFEIGKSGVHAGEVVEDLLFKAAEKAGVATESVAAIVSTGYGRVNVPLSKKQVTEITCNAKGVYEFYPTARMVIDVGGQDSKIIRIGQGGRVQNFIMNDKCAAGTGKFLEVAAETLGLRVEELAAMSCKATKAAEISSTCTVFAQTEIISLIANQISSENIIAGLHEAIALRIATLLWSVKTEGDVVMTGGVARNMGVVNAIEKAINRSIIIPQNPQILTAYGAALLGS